MNDRQRKKYLNMGVCCRHRMYSRFIVTNDPYPMYNEEDKCKLGKFRVRNGFSNECFYCKHYTLSKKSMRNAREWIKFKGKKKRYYIINSIL